MKLTVQYDKPLTRAHETRATGAEQDTRGDETKHLYNAMDGHRQSVNSSFEAVSGDRLISDQRQANQIQQTLASSTQEIWHQATAINGNHIEEEMLKLEMKCILCEDEHVNILFLPCTHHTMCMSCAQDVTMCPMCCKNVKEKIRTYL